jgi:DNA-directed RNA polymerase subunit beta'
MRFYSPEEVMIAYNEGQTGPACGIKVRARVEDEEGNMVTRLIETTTGRVIFNE